MQKVKNNKNKAQDRPLQSTAKKFDSGLTGGGGGGQSRLLRYQLCTCALESVPLLRGPALYSHCFCPRINEHSTARDRERGLRITRFPPVA
jgi:hypothetical protein